MTEFWTNIYELSFPEGDEANAHFSLIQEKKYTVDGAAGKKIADLQALKKAPEVGSESLRGGYSLDPDDPSTLTGEFGGRHTREFHLDTKKRTVSG